MTVTDVPASDMVDERGLTCRGGFRPCECSPGETGRDYCVSMAFEGVCRCGDAAPPSTDASADAARDGAASDGAASDGSASDAGDDASGDASSKNGPRAERYSMRWQSAAQPSPGRVLPSSQRSPLST